MKRTLLALGALVVAIPALALPAFDTSVTSFDTYIAYDGNTAHTADDADSGVAAISYSFDKIDDGAACLGASYPRIPFGLSTTEPSTCGTFASTNGLSTGFFFYYNGGKGPVKNRIYAVEQSGTADILANGGNVFFMKERNGTIEEANCILGRTCAAEEHQFCGRGNIWDKGNRGGPTKTDVSASDVQMCFDDQQWDI